MIDPRHSWRQVNVTFPDWDNAEQTALAVLACYLATAQPSQLADTWFFIRKYPCWRLRYRTGTEADESLRRYLDELAARHEIGGWTPAVYEPETRAFGGPAALAKAPQLFHHDSPSLLAYLRDNRTAGKENRREISIMLCSILMRAAGQDWYEQGDIWARIASHRPPSPGRQPARPGTLQDSIRRLMTVDAESQMRDKAPLAALTEWAHAYAAAGRDLASLAATGTLHRGIRAVLAHHVIFAWNRLGLHYPAQAGLAATAATVVFGPDPAASPSIQEHS